MISTWFSYHSRKIYVRNSEFIMIHNVFAEKRCVVAIIEPLSNGFLEHSKCISDLLSYIFIPYRTLFTNMLMHR